MAVLQAGAIRGEGVKGKIGRIGPSLIVVCLLCSTSDATSIVILANKMQIGIAADHKVTSRVRGVIEPDVCKIMSHGDFFFSFSGTVSKGGMYGAEFNVMDILVKASKGLSDLSLIVERFDKLVAVPLQRQIYIDYANHRESFREQIGLVDSPVLELILFRVLASGTEMEQSVFPADFRKTVRIKQPFHRACRAGVGECQLTVGAQDGMMEYIQEHPFTSDLAADAERLVEFERRRRPMDVGGKITVLLIDSSGVHPADTSDKCPVEWRRSPPVPR